VALLPRIQLEIRQGIGRGGMHRAGTCTLLRTGSFLQHGGGKAA